MVNLIEEYNAKKFLHKEETYKIIGCCMEVHKHLGLGLLEIVYKDALEVEFKRNSIPFEREKKYTISYKDVLLNHSFFADFVVFDKIILEVKCTQKGFAQEHEKQLINYLAISKNNVGLLINFGESALAYKRMVL